MDSGNTSAVTFTCAVYRGVLVHVSLPIAVCIILVLSFIQRTKKDRRTGSQQNICRGLFSLIYPIDLFDNHDRIPHCLAFGAASSLVLDLFIGDFKSYFFGWVIPEWGKISVGCIVTVEIAIDCFPFFACITCKSRLLAYGMGFFYLTFWLIMLIGIKGACRLNEDAVQEQDSLVLYQSVPVLICIVLLMVYFLAMFITILVQRHKGIKLTKAERLYTTHEAIHVRNLFNKPKKEVVYTGWRARLFKIYKPYSGFIYPTRVLMPCFVSLIVLYQVAFWIIPPGGTYITYIICLLQTISIEYYQLVNESEAIIDEINVKFNQAQTGFQVSWAIASALSIFLPSMYIPLILNNYRKHLMSMWAGKHKLPTNVELNSAQSIVSSLKYIGFQVAVFLTGYMFIQGILFVVLGCLTLVVLGCIWYFQLVFVEYFVQLLLPSLVIGISIMKSQDVFVKLFFIQDKLNPLDSDRPLALKRRVWFLIYCYVTMFLNLLFGLILAVKRVVISLIIAICMLPRIDRPIYLPGFEHNDSVYMMYLGNLQTENAHSNPILVTFCHLMVFDILRPQRKRQKLKRQSSNLVRRGFVNNPEPSIIDLESTGEEKEPQPLLKYFRWHLAYTLIKNPSLIELRKGSATLPDHEVEVSDGGEAKFVSTGEGNGGHQSPPQMQPHRVEVMKRQNLEKKNSSLLNSFVDPGQIVLKDAPKHPEASSSEAPLASQLPPATNADVPLSEMLPSHQEPSQSAIQSGPVVDFENQITRAVVGKRVHTVNFESNA